MGGLNEIKKQYANKMYCVSPAVMLATFVIEVFLAVYIMWRYKNNKVTRLAVGLLICLATIQLAEFAVCGAYGVDIQLFALVGSLAITLLPPLGMHLMYEISRSKSRLWLKPAYLAATVFGVYFLMNRPIDGAVCAGNYIIFNVSPEIVLPYSIYFYGLLIIGIGLSLNLAKTAIPHIRKSLYGLAIGHLSFLLPTTAVYILHPETRASIPSVMCGFAVILALILAFWVVPKALSKR